MKIKKIYFKDVGPLKNELSPICFYDNWDNTPQNSVLISGPNGSGKSYLMTSISYLWEALGNWLYNRKVVSKGNKIYEWFMNKCLNIAIVLEDVPDFENNNEKNKTVCLFFCNGDWREKVLKEENNIDYYIGEEHNLDIALKNMIAFTPLRDIVSLNKEQKRDFSFFSKWGEIYKKFIISREFNETPNMIYLDAEARNWKIAKKNIGQIKGEDLSKRWIFKYEASDDWNTQLESSLINLSVTNRGKYEQIIDNLNYFFKGKKIQNIIREDMRIWVKIDGTILNEHLLDELSAGERQVLIMIYNVSRWLEKGGIAIIDEADLFLHSSLIDSTISTLEKIVKEKNGQLIISSHSKDLWERYENRRIRIELGDIFI